MAEAMDVGIADPNACTECKVSPGEIRRAKKLFCRTCWIYHCDFRFRKRIFELGKPQKNPNFIKDTESDEAGSSRQTKTTSQFSTERVLIDFDGGTDNSMSLLYLLRDAILSIENSTDGDRTKTLPFPFICTILYISAGVHENGEINLNKKENIRVKNFEKLKLWFQEIQQSDILRNFFPSIIVTSLEESLAITKDNDADLKLLDITETLDAKIRFPLSTNLHETLVSLVEDLRTKTSRVDLLQILRLNLAKAVACHLKLNKVLVIEDQTNLAVKMFSLMSLGRGIQLADEMNFVTNQEGVTIARPLMDLSSDDIRDYMKCMNLIEKANAEKSGKIDNIKAQCEDFILTLQKDYSSTVPTLTRIGSKLQPSCKQNRNGTDATGIQNNLICTLCKNIRDEVDTVQNSLCYACSHIFNEMRTPSLLIELLSLKH